MPREGPPEGRARWWRWLPALAWAVATWLLSSSSDPPGQGLVDLPYEDKLAHLGLFAIQAALLRLAGLRFAAAVLLAVALGAVDELHQAFVPGRSPDAADLAVDALGAAAGAAAVGWLARRGGTAR